MRPRVGARHPPDRRRDHHRPLRRAAPRHPPRRPLLRAGDGAVVPHSGDARDPASSPIPMSWARFRPTTRSGSRSVIPSSPSSRWVRWCCRSRRRGAVCRYGPLGAGPDRAGLVHPGLPVPDAQLPRAGAADPAPPRNRHFTLLPPGPGLALDAPGRPGHPGDDHRLPGGDLGRLFRCPPGGTARLPAPLDRAAYLRTRRTDLHPRCETGSSSPASCC